MNSKFVVLFVSHTSNTHWIELIKDESVLKTCRIAFCAPGTPVEPYCPSPGSAVHFVLLSEKSSLCIPVFFLPPSHHTSTGTQVCRCHCTVTLSLSLISSLISCHGLSRDGRVPAGRRYSDSAFATTYVQTHSTTLYLHSWASWGIIGQPGLWQWKFTSRKLWFNATVSHCVCLFFQQSRLRRAIGLWVILGHLRCYSLKVSSQPL